MLGFNSDNYDSWVLGFGVLLGDPREDAVWETLAAKLARPFGGLPPSVVSVDAGFLTSSVQAQCARRRWWIPTVGRAGAGKPIARGIGPSGLAVCGKDDGSAWWAGRVETGDVHFPRTILRTELAEIAASEVLTAEVDLFDGVRSMAFENHLWDAAILVHGRHCVHSAPATLQDALHATPCPAHRRPFRLAAV